ncbi:MAG: hypothetical protein LBH86_06705 [Oscillospiraceae bacterium]|jgi:hypothetical protein|nr:hypothetical protein [Oscillospiraceae bacterium]
MNEFITPDYLGTFAGMVAAVTALTQIAKQFFKVDPKWISLGAALVMVTVCKVLPHPPGLSDIFLELLNAVFVCGAAIGLFETGKSAVRTLSRSSTDKTR